MIEIVGYQFSNSGILVSKKLKPILIGGKHAKAHTRHLRNDPTDKARGGVGTDDYRPAQFWLPQMFRGAAIEQIEIGWEPVQPGGIGNQMNQRLVTFLDELRREFAGSLGFLECDLADENCFHYSLGYVP